MSRSRKKHPVFKDNDGAGKKKRIKKLFNRRLRRNADNLDLPDGNAYKRQNEAWDICDFRIEPDPDDPKQGYQARMK